MPVMRGVSTLDVATPALAVNAALGVSVAVTVAGIYGIVSYVPPGKKRRALLASLGNKKLVPTDYLMTLLGAKDPVADVRSKLLETALDPDLALALRTALMLTL
jgi:hypothetical protein